MASERIPVIIDADTANEIDDLYAIVRAVREPCFEVKAVCSTHWRIHDRAPQDSVGESQKLNQELLRLLGRTDIPHPRGGNRWMGYAWGGTEPSDSDAVRFIIETARTMPEGRKLVLISQGAMTNAASAVALAPDILSKISVYLMGFFCDPETGVWNKNEFNVRNDLNAADYLLNKKGLDLHVMTATTSIHYKFPREDAFARLDAAGPVGRCLKERWMEISPDSKAWVMWDVALIQAIAKPFLARQKTVFTPPENTRREVCIYTWVDTAAMYEDFWTALP